jgi:hypothetical protein|tara:strand:+ start:1147 stop:1254 length:108 start_codon:yes stop_codon:yes gene_type:complete
MPEKEPGRQWEVEERFWDVWLPAGDRRQKEAPGEE